MDDGWAAADIDAASLALASSVVVDENSGEWPWEGGPGASTP